MSIVRPDTFTITTFWLDWLLMPILLAGAWFTIRWALADSRKASDLEIGGESFLPTWAFSIPLFIAAAAWVIAGFGTLIKEDYWEMRVIFVAFLLWTLCCLVGAILLSLSFLRKRRGFGAVGGLNLIGLALMSLLMILPGLIDHSSPANVTLLGHIWFVLLAVSVGLLTAGMLLGYPYKFPRFPLGLGVLFFIGWGLSEVAFRQASFPWLVRIWKLHLGLEYLDAFPLSDGWRIAGAVKFLVGIGTVAILVIASRRMKSCRSSLLVWALLVITVFVGCAGKETTGHRFEVAVENGVSIAITTGGPRHTGNLFTFRPSLTLREDPSREESMLFSPSSFTLRPDGNYYVADDGNRRIAVFGPEGEFVRSFGRRGAGPGEFQMVELQWLHGDVLSIFDYSQQRTTYYRTDGTLLDVVTSPGGRLITWMDRLPDDTYLIGGVRGEWGEGISSTEYRAVVLEPSGRDTIGVIRTGLIADFFILHYSQNGQSSTVGGHSLPFSGRPLIKYIPDRGILMTNGDRPELAWYDLIGRKMKVIRVEMESRPVSADLKQEYEAQQRRRFRENAERTGRPEREFPDYEYADAIGFCRRVTVDDAGYIWCLDVERLDLNEPGEGWLHHVFDPEGRYLGAAELPSSRPAIGGGRLMAFIEDPETGAQVATVFKIIPVVEGLIYPQ